jgi:hypothetical protein
LRFTYQSSARALAILNARLHRLTRLRQPRHVRSRSPQTSSIVHGTETGIPFFVPGVNRHWPTRAVASLPQTVSEVFGT